ncbi:DUF3347 domain-containing protein [Pedobacter sp. MC2016-14]|uniref:DUF3347 domain-containing protein n=1 Tax=Pedobacter sp. MC2016-14 TaxID=2897327 RepID=UPI001E4C513D|nr:DUF3347 domain-containing protein [Pedobacter sp. MC2016-14]MCD0487661.1 DUF3347 domain-containing protein [Pedobacter sp. MC2016-14]
MKNLILAIFLAFTFGSVNAQAILKTSAQEVATPELAKQREALKKGIITNYLGLKSCLVASDSVQAAKHAADLVTALDRFKFKKLDLEQMNAATTMRGKIKGLAKSIADTYSINKQRGYFMELSEGMWSIMERFVPEKTVLYLQECPMTSKVWISDEKEIKNPYYPKNMLDCGAVKAELGSK